MFTVGDKVVYPMHGAGIIESIEDKQILGETRSYYIMRIPYGNMQVMVPATKNGETCIRPIVSEADIESVCSILAQESTAMDDNWNRRLRDNMEKLKTGDINQVAEVVRNLSRVDKVKKLSSGEKNLLVNARQILVSEIVLVKGISKEDALEMIEQFV